MNSIQTLTLTTAALLALGAFAEAEYAFRPRMAALHPNRLAADAAPVAADETVVDGTWKIVCAADDPVLKHAADDLRDFFTHGMSFDPGRTAVGQSGPKTIFYRVDPTLEKLQAKVEVKEDRILVSGVTAREALQGGIRLEEMMGVRGRPAAKRGAKTFTRLFSPRMTHSGWAVEKFPDVYMDQLAHAGMDAILVFIADPPDVSRVGKEDMNELVERARIHGLDVYAYCWFPVKAAKYSPTEPEAEKWYEETYGAIVKNAPGIKGLVCVGESVGFPTKDGTTAGYWWGRKEERVKGKPLCGFYPTMEWVPWLEKVTRATRKFRPDLDILFWTYNWYSRPAEERLPLLEKIPTNITMLVTFAMGDTPEKKLGMDTWMWDYSITRPGPGTVFKSEAEVAKRRGIRLYSMANCGGRTWDLGCAPCHPVPDRWIDRFRNIRDAQENYGLSGLMESHHYGFQPNLISEIAKSAFTREMNPKDLDESLADFAARDFGRANVKGVLAAWRDWSEAFHWHSAHHCDLAGPYRTGPVYPFVLPGGERPVPLEPKYEYYEGKRYGKGWRYLENEYEMPADLLPTYIEMSRREVAAFERGSAKMRAILPNVPEAKRPAAARQLANGEFHLATARTMLNVREYRLAGLAYVAKETPAAAREKARQKLLKLIADERENVRRTIPVVETDSALGWEPTMLYVCGARALEWKLRQLDDAEAELVPAASKTPMRVVLTFDDALKDHLLIAAPLLEQHGWRGVFNIVTDWIGKDEKYLTWDDVRELIRRGHEVATHTVSHQHNVTLLDAGKTNEVRREIALSRDLIAAKTGFVPRYMCPPYCQQNAATARICREEGLREMTGGRTNFGQGNSDGVEAFILSSVKAKRVRADILVHGVSAADHGGWAPFPDRASFARHLDRIAELEKAGLIVVTDYDGYLSDCALKAPAWPHHGVIALSFDDRNLKDWTEALPLFSKHGATATFCIVGPIADGALDFARKALGEGHEIALHGLQHLNADKAVAEKGEAIYWEQEIQPQLDACKAAGIPIFSFAYPNCRHDARADALFITNGFTRLRGSIPGVKSPNPYDPTGAKLSAWRPVATSDDFFIPASAHLTETNISNVIMGDYYHTDICDILRAVERCGDRAERLSIVSHGISPNARRISMKTEWLERMLSEANRLGVVIHGLR